MDLHIYLGIRFDVWTGQGAWLWRVVNGRCGAGAVGAASNEADAVRDACNSIEGMYAAAFRAQSQSATTM
jgi:hypothetical protein